MPVKRAHKAILQGPTKRRFGVIDRTAKKYWHGDTAGYDRYNLVGATIVHTGRKRSKQMEKRFFREMKDPQRDFRILNELKEAGIKVVPDYHLALTKNEKGQMERSLVMADLSERGKKLVIPGNKFAGNEAAYKAIAALKNYGLLMRQMQRERLAASRLGFDLNYDAWLFVIDRKRKTGKLFVTDVDSLWRQRRPHQDPGVHGLRRAGVKPNEIRATTERVDRIIRHAMRPVQVSMMQVARSNPQFKDVIVSAIQGLTRRNPRLREVSHLFLTLASIALMPQIGGALNNGHSLGLNKEERHKLNALIAVLSKNGHFKLHKTSKTHEFATWAHDTIYHTDWESKRRFVPTIRKESRSKQWQRNRFGALVGAEMARASKRLGSPVFRFDPALSSQWSRVEQELGLAKSKEAIEEIVKRERVVVLNHLVEELSQTFHHDVRFLGRLRILRDLRPYNDSEVIGALNKHIEETKDWWKKPKASDPDYKGFT